VSCMEYDKQGDVEEDHADDVHADDVAMEVVEHGQNGVHQERDDEGSQADPNANGVHKKEVMRKNPIFALKMCSRVVHVTNFLMFC